MEAVPRLPMLNFDLKTSPENPDFNVKLRHLIAGLGEDPSGFDKEIREFESLRANTCIRPSESIEGVATAKKYYCQLLFMKNRFKISSESPFEFTWKDIYSNVKYSVSDINHELASVLYNIGALHSVLGSEEQRQESDGMKMAVAHFQCAAWAFHALPDKHPQDSDSDLASEVLAFKSGLCLAQAQECILEKSLLDNRKPGIIAKVCGQVVEYYKQALKQLDFSSSKEMVDHIDSFFDVVGTKQSRCWRAYIEFKISYYVCLSYLHMGMASEETGRWGERVAFYEAASSALAVAARSNKEDRVEQMFSGVNDALIYTNDVCQGKLDISKKENEFIYHEKVPDVDSLPSIKGASLVKGIPFDEQDPEVSGGDLFSRIVTLETHAASSMYSEELAKMLRTVANDSLVVYLSSLQLEDIPETAHLTSMPQEIIDCCAGLSVRPQCVPQLQQAMAKLASVSADVEASLQEIQAMLKEEERAEEEFCAVLGPRPKPIMSELERETQKYHAAHSMASESNLTLHEAMRLHVKNLKLLSQSVDDLKINIPSLTQLDDKTLNSLEDMRKIMQKVDEMRNQRNHLEQELRNAVQEDDITSRIAVKGNNEAEKIFEQELKKHDKIIGYIRQNISAQTSIVQAMSERNAEYADARFKVDSVLRQREEALGQLVASYHAYEDLLNKTTKGLEFYDKLDGNVSKLLDRVKGVVKVQDEDRNQILQSSEKKAAEARALSLSLISGGDSKMSFTPAAPPPDTPDTEPVVSFSRVPATSTATAAPAPVSSNPPYHAAAAGGGGRPRLGDYLSGGYKAPGAAPASAQPPAAGSEPAAPAPHAAAADTSRRPRLSDFLKPRDQKEVSQDQLGVRPQPLGASNPDPPSGHLAAPAPGQQLPPEHQVTPGQAAPGATAAGPPAAYTQQQQQQQYLQMMHQQYYAAQQFHSKPPTSSQQPPVPSNSVPPPPAASQPGYQQQFPGYMPSQQQQQQQQPQQPSTEPQQPQGKPQQPQTQPPVQPPVQHQVHYPVHHVSQPPTQPPVRPSAQHQIQPSVQPSSQPQVQPSYQPSVQSSNQPSVQPSVQPSAQHSIQSSIQPPTQPSVQTSAQPPHQPLAQHLAQPTFHPSVQQPSSTAQPQIPSSIQQQQHPSVPSPVRLHQNTPHTHHQTNFYSHHQPQYVSHQAGHMRGYVVPQQPTQQQQFGGVYQQPQPQQGTNVQKYWHQQQYPGNVQHQVTGSPQHGQQQQQQQQPQYMNSPSKPQVAPSNTPSTPISSGTIQQHQRGFPVHNPQLQQQIPASPHQWQQQQQRTVAMSPQPQQPQQYGYQHPAQPHAPQQQPVVAAPAVSSATDATFPASSNVSLLSGLAAAPATLRPAVPMPGTIPQSPAPAPAPAVTETSNLEHLKTLDTKLNAAAAPSQVSRPQTAVDPPPEYLKQKLESLEQYFFTLNTKTLEDEWKQIMGNFDTIQKKKESVSVARCYPYSNRAPDILPFDYNRLVLKDCKDDYINASLVVSPDCKESPFIVTQTPFHKNLVDFWSMIWQEGTETVVCLSTDQEMADSIYLPAEKNSIIREGLFSVSILSVKVADRLIERVVNLHHNQLKQTRALIHIQLRDGGDSGAVGRAAETMGDRRSQQRFPNKAVLVHCADGGNRSGTFLAVASLIADIGSLDEGWPQVREKVAHLMTQRKNIFRDKIVIRSIYEALISYVKSKLGVEENETSAVQSQSLVNQDFVGLSVASLKAELQPTLPDRDINVPEDSEDVFVAQHETCQAAEDESDGKVGNPSLTQLDLDPLVNNSVMNIPSDLTKLADLSIDEGKTKKFTKDDFNSPSKGMVPLNDPADPLSQLDPLWSLK